MSGERVTGANPVARRSIVAVYVRAILAVSAWAAAAPAYSQIAAYIMFFHDCIGPGCCDRNGSVTPFGVTSLVGPMIAGRPCRSRPGLPSIEIVELGAVVDEH